MNINIYTKMHGATIKIITRAGENTCKHKGMAYLCADTKKILLKTWKKQNGEYMIMGKPQKTVEMLVSLHMHWRGGDVDEHVGFVIDDDTNTDGDTYDTTAHPLCRWS